MKRTFGIVLLAGLPLCGGAAPLRGADIPGLDLSRPRPKVAVLGTFHMDNPNLDYVKTSGDDMLSEKRQAEIREVVGRLKAFRPTKIALESPFGTEDLGKTYALYVSGRHKLTADEREQLGFRLASELHLPTVSPVDWKKDMDLGAVLAAAPAAGQAALAQRLEKLFGSIGATLEGMKGKTVLEQLRFHNGPESDAYHRGYLLLAEIGKGASYPGADQVAGWYERNLKIAVNILRIVESPDDRVLVIFGSGHAPLLRQFLRESPDAELVDVNRYLAAD